MTVRVLIITFLCLVSSWAEDKPNVIFILADDLGYHELGSFGQKKIKTPHLDKLREQGMKFTDTYSGNAVCAPSRCTLLTGMHPGHAWIRNNGEVKPEGQRPIPEEQVTIAELFKAAGYTTGAFGKWGLGFPGSEGDPLNQGFDRFYGYNCQRHAHSYYPSYLWDNDKTVKLNNNPPVPGHAGLPKGADDTDPRSYNIFKGQDYASDRINEQVLEFVKENKDKPFFLYYPTLIPHVALHVPDEELKQYHDLNWNDPPFTRRSKQNYGYTPHFTPKAAYAAMITRMDRYIGNVMNLLEELKIADNTIVIFTSDNGTTHLKYEVDYEFFNSVGEFRGLKGSLYEGGIRVPMIAKWSEKIKAGSECNRRIGFEDILPTLADAAGIGGIPDNIDGISFFDSLLGKQQSERPFLYREFSGYGGQVAAWMGKWKAVRQKLHKNKNAPIELYNLEQDLSEKNDLASKYPEVVDEFKKLMKKEHIPSEIFKFPALDK
ncbi:MAG: arylsulfatase [Lentisphaerales bacterium]|nr:arylsulfatase [Lentisphaerales bacterium]